MTIYLDITYHWRRQHDRWIHFTWQELMYSSNYCRSSGYPPSLLIWVLAYGLLLSQYAQVLLMAIIKDKELLMAKYFSWAFKPTEFTRYFSSRQIQIYFSCTRKLLPWELRKQYVLLSWKNQSLIVITTSVYIYLTQC